MTGGELLASKAIEAATSEKAQGLIKGLFGKAFEETGEMIADQVRLRRFKNQIKIFEKAQSYLKESKIEPQKVNLKVLAPLIELSSYEEDENLQERWANLIKNILSKPFAVVLQQNSIEVLNKISNEEAVLLEHVYQKVNESRAERARRMNARRVHKAINKSAEDIPIDWISLKIDQLSNELKQEQESFEMQISNLVALGTLKYETEVDVNATKSSDNPDDTDVDVDVDVTDYKRVRITKLGYVFVDLCRKGPESKSH